MSKKYTNQILINFILILVGLFKFVQNILKMTAFTKFLLPQDNDLLFDQLSQSIAFEPITKGRSGAVLISDEYVDGSDFLMPLVRTTTQYTAPCQLFKPIHKAIIENMRGVIMSVSDTINIPDVKNVNFNNILAEIYDDNYTTMKYHSDQAIDLDDDSYICLFSCYNQCPIPDQNLRKLRIKPKNGDGTIKSTSTNEIDIELNNCSAVLFSVADNSKYLHKIILDHVMNKKHAMNGNDVKWLGLTMRLSKTYIKFINEIPYFVNKDEGGIELTLATQAQAHQFYKSKREENEEENDKGSYTKIYFTISKSDIINPFKSLVSYNHHYLN